jgi:hypothetical protein
VLADMARHLPNPVPNAQPAVKAMAAALDKQTYQCAVNLAVCRAQAGRTVSLKSSQVVPALCLVHSQHCWS